MNLSRILLCLLAICLWGCDDNAPQKASTAIKPTKGVSYYLSVALPGDAPALTRDNITAATLLPVPAPKTPVDAKRDTAVPEVRQAFSEMAIQVLDLSTTDNGLYRLQLKESPQVDGVIRINTGSAVLQALMLETGSLKRPIRVDSISTAAVRMFLSRVEAQRSYNNVDAEQVATLLSVVNKHLATLDVPDKLDTPQQIAWYAEQAQKACTIRFSDLSSSAECAAFTLGGEVKGLVGQLQLDVNHGEPLTLSSDGPFMFRTGLINRSYYEVAVKEQPDRQTCVVKYGVGRIHGQNVDSVLVKCEENRYQLAGVAEGVTGPVKLKLNGNLEMLTLRQDGAFQFKKQLKHGEAYEITLAHQPQELTCALSHGAGYIIDHVADISIVCEPLLFQVGGVITGLNGNLRLQINQGEELTLTQDGEFAFTSDFVHKAAYDVQILEQPAGQTCQLSKAQGKLALNDIRNVQIQCTTTAHTLAGKIEGLKGEITMTLNGDEALTLAAPGEFRFKTALPYGTAYNIVVSSAPKGQQCTIRQGAGTLAGDIADLLVQCEPVHFHLGGKVSGLAGAFQVRLNNRQEVLAIPGNGPFEFATRLVSGARYDVVMDTQPAGQSCSILNGVGRIGVQDVRNLMIQCDFQSFKLGGSVSGLKGSMKLALNGKAESLTLTTNGMFAFSSELRTGEAYDVTVAVPPVGLQCEVHKGQGQVNAANIVDVKVICVPQGPAARAAAVKRAASVSTPAEIAPSAKGAPSAEVAPPVEEGPKTFAAPFPQVIKP